MEWQPTDWIDVVGVVDEISLAKIACYLKWARARSMCETGTHCRRRTFEFGLLFLNTLKVDGMSEWRLARSFVARETMTRDRRPSTSSWLVSSLHRSIYQSIDLAKRINCKDIGSARFPPERQMMFLLGAQHGILTVS